MSKFLNNKSLINKLQIANNSSLLTRNCNMRNLLDFYQIICIKIFARFFFNLDLNTNIIMINYNISIIQSINSINILNIHNKI